MLVLKPYFPNQRQQYVSKPAEFSWFLCGTKYYDKRLKKHVVLLPKGTMLYSEKSGKTYEVAIDEVSLVIGDKAPKKYHGTASVKDCIPSGNPVWCKEITINLPKKLVKVVPIDGCKVIEYAKRNNSAIREKLPSFPTCKQIDKSLKTSKCHKVSRSLSQALDDLFVGES